MTNNQKFKPGDKVRCIDVSGVEYLLIKLNQVYTVNRMGSRGEVFCDELIGFYYEDRFVLAEPEIEVIYPNRKFIKAFGYYIKNSYTITHLGGELEETSNHRDNGVGKHIGSLNIETGEFHPREKKPEPVEPPLTFYDLKAGDWFKWKKNDYTGPKKCVSTLAKSKMIYYPIDNLVLHPCRIDEEVIKVETSNAH